MSICSTDKTEPAELNRCIGETVHITPGNSLTMKLVHQLVDIDTAMKAAKQAQEKGCYLDAAKKLKSVGSLLEQCSGAEFQLEIFETLISEKPLLEEHFLCERINLLYCVTQSEFCTCPVGPKF
jgi:hypothetical protein